MYMAQKAKKKSKLRHAEYYDMQKTFDSLYADSKSGEVFGHLMDIISAPNNIKLAFRNIKGNDGSHTAGTDGRTIESLAVMSEDKFVKLIQKQFRRYEPKAVKRVEIPKPNGKMRPLGIPCIIDRIVQQCILQSWSQSVKQSSMSTLMGSDRVGAQKMRFPMRMDSPKGTSFTM